MIMLGVVPEASLVSLATRDSMVQNQSSEESAT
jgi:hypothetical protein